MNVSSTSVPTRGKGSSSSAYADGHRLASRTRCDNSNNFAGDRLQDTRVIVVSVLFTNGCKTVVFPNELFQEFVELCNRKATHGISGSLHALAC